MDHFDSKRQVLIFSFRDERGVWSNETQGQTKDPNNKGPQVSASKGLGRPKRRAFFVCECRIIHER